MNSRYIFLLNKNETFYSTTSQIPMVIRIDLAIYFRTYWSEFTCKQYFLENLKF